MLNGAVTEAEGNDLWERIESALDRVRPAIQADGGDVDLVEVKDGVAAVRMVGACRACPMSHYTLNRGISMTIQEAVPEIVQVVAVPEEDDGFNF